MRAITLIRLAVAAMALSVCAAKAETDQEFYAKRNLRLLVGYGPGTGYDVYARAVGRFIGRHVPGKPNVVVENMPGAGGLTMANFFYNVAPKDGSAIGLLVNLFLEPLMGNKLARYEVLKFNWLGSVSRSTPLCFTWHTTGIKTLDDVKNRETLVGATGRSSDSYYYPQLVNTILGTKFKPVLGYPDSGAIGVAMERGELHGFCSFTYSSIKSARPEWLSNNRINILVQLGLTKSPELPNVPLLLDVVKDEAARQSIVLMAGNWEAARPFATPPGVPAARVQTLGDAFMATMRDEAFLADAKRMNIEVDPIDGAIVRKIIADLYTTPKPVIDHLIKIRSVD